MLHVHAEGAVSWLPLCGRTQAVLLDPDPGSWTGRAVATAAQHVPHRLVVEVHVKIGRRLSAFSHVQQSQGHEEGLNLTVQTRLIKYSHLLFVARQRKKKKNQLKQKKNHPYVSDRSGLTLADAALQHEVE